MTRKKLLSIVQAEQYAAMNGKPVSARGLRSAADAGNIPGAVKLSRDWIIPLDGLVYYLQNRPKVGRPKVG